MMLNLKRVIGRFLCRIIGHRNRQLRDDTGILIACTRCGVVKAFHQFAYTARHEVTRGDIKRRMAEHPPDGYRFVECNWKKRKAKFVNRLGDLTYVAF